MSVYYLSAVGLNSTVISPSANLAWVKLFPADTDPANWTVQTFPADLTGVTDGSINDQASSYVYFAEGSPPAGTPASSKNVSALTYDIAIPVGSSVELDPTKDWYVAYPIHGAYLQYSTGPLKANQVVTIVATRDAGSIYFGPSSGPSEAFGGALLARGNSSNTIPTGAFTDVLWDTVGANGCYAVGNVSGGTGVNPLVMGAGVYHIDAVIDFFPNSTGNRYVGFIFVPQGGTLSLANDPKFVWTGASGASLGGGQLPVVSWEGYLPANTIVVVVVYQDSGSSLALVNDRTTLQIRQVA